MPSLCCCPFHEGKLNTYQYRRALRIAALQKAGQKLVPKAIELHKQAIAIGTKLKVWYEREDESQLVAMVAASINARNSCRVSVLLPGVNGQGHENCIKCDCMFMVRFLFRKRYVQYYYHHVHCIFYRRNTAGHVTMRLLSSMQPRLMNGCGERGGKALDGCSFCVTTITCSLTTHKLLGVYLYPLMSHISRMGLLRLCPPS